jgi:hypothetical protein
MRQNRLQDDGQGREADRERTPFAERQRVALCLRRRISRRNATPEFHRCRMSWAVSADKPAAERCAAGKGATPLRASGHGEDLEVQAEARGRLQALRPAGRTDRAVTSPLYGANGPSLHFALR